jgi:hypothetical protein
MIGIRIACQFEVFRRLLQQHNYNSHSGKSRKFQSAYRMHATQSRHFRFLDTNLGKKIFSGSWILDRSIPMGTLRSQGKCSSDWIFVAHQSVRSLYVQVGMFLFEQRCAQRIVLFLTIPQNFEGSTLFRTVLSVAGKVLNSGAVKMLRTGTLARLTIDTGVYHGLCGHCNKCNRPTALNFYCYSASSNGPLSLPVGFLSVPSA